VFYNFGVNKKIFFILIASGFLFVTLPFLQAGHLQESSQSSKYTEEPLSESSREWLDEVVPYIITKAEKEFFLSLPNEIERGKFIQGFWRKRDPNPETPVNEFKMDYYKRVALANKFFGSSGVDGWRTDRGKVYILLGPPNDIQRDMMPSTFSTPVYHGPKEIWNYWGLSNPRLPYNLEFVFVDRLGTGDYVLERNVRLGETGGQPFDLDASHYYFDYLEIMAEAMKNPYENLDELRGIITTQVAYEQITFQSSMFYFKGAGKKTHIPLAVSIPFTACTRKEIEGKYFISLNLLVQVSNKLGQIIFERSKDIDIKQTSVEMEAAKTEAIHAQTSVSLEPEAYKIHILVLDNYSGKVGTIHREIVVPEFETGELCSSDIILFGSEPDGEKENRVGRQEKAGTIKNSFKMGEEMNVYVEAYNLTINPESKTYDFEVMYEYFDQDKSLLSMPAPGENRSEEKDIRIETSFVLKNFRPGDYVLKVKVKDLNSGSSASKQIQFSVTQ